LAGVGRSREASAGAGAPPSVLRHVGEEEKEREEREEGVDPAGQWARGPTCRRVGVDPACPAG
jgi:hypothetical protein